MRLIPVMDLLKGRVVHAVKGVREQYKPVKSVLCNTADPQCVAAAFRKLGLNEIYVADLDAIESSGRMSHGETIAGLARTDKLSIMLDSGISNTESALKSIDSGVRKLVIGSETLRTWDVIKEIPAKVDPNRLVFSIDMRAGKILSRCPEMSSISLNEVLEHLQNTGWREVILLDLVRVGSGEGIDLRLLSELRSRFPEIRLLAGGGISSADEIFRIQSLGIDGILVATALHRGTIRQPQISQITTL